MLRSRSKILDWEALAGQVETWRQQGRRIVQCHGVFDLLHIGHIRYFQKARELGDVLLVTLTPDRFVNKGPHRPVFAERLRLEAVAALDCVDAVALNVWPTAREAITGLRPHVYAKGAEFRENKTPELLLEESAAAAVGTQVAFVEELTSSSTLLINRYLSVFDEQVESYLDHLRSQYRTEQMLDWLATARDQRVLVVGETVIDEFYSCAALGQSTKAPIVSTRYESHQRFLSGAASVANHLAAFCREVVLLTIVGDRDQEVPWIRERLRDNVRLLPLPKHDSPTIVKRRYREPYFDIPLFAVNFLNDTPLRSDQVEWLESCLAAELPAADLVAIADYGHGMLTPATIETLCRSDRYLAVSTQANAANLGLHTLSKYRRADYFSLARRELEMECRRPGVSLEEMLVSVADRLGSRTAAVTLGRQGCLCLQQGAPLHTAPALARKVVDRIGAGDAFFAITTLCAWARAPSEVLAFLGNLIGAEAVSALGNPERRAGESLPRSVASLLR